MNKTEIEKIKKQVKFNMLVCTIVEVGIAAGCMILYFVQLIIDKTYVPFYLLFFVFACDIGSICVGAVSKKEWKTFLKARGIE